MRTAELEEWKGRYLFYEDGRIWSYISNKFRQPFLTKEGYYVVGLMFGGRRKTFSLHRLIARSFIPNPYRLPQVNHKNGNKADSRVTNLEWCTREHNVRHSIEILGNKHGAMGLRGEACSLAKLTQKQV